MSQREDPAAAWRHDFAVACERIEREKLSLPDARRLLLRLARRYDAPDEAYPLVSGAIRKLFPDYRDQDAQDSDGVATDPSGTGAEDSARAVLVRLSVVKPEKVSWLWPGRIPFGKITIIDGDPNLGKSTLALDIAARLTAGKPFPDGTKCEPGGVVILSAEDGLADTIRPRLDAAGADTGQVIALTAVRMPNGNEVFPSISANVEAIEEAVRKVNARLVVIDPLMAYLGSDVNGFKDQDVRRVLASLAAMAERTGAAVVVIRHLNKRDGGQAIYRGGGSIGIIGAARSGLLVGKDPDDEGRRILAPTKHNLCEPPPSLSFRLEGTPNGAARVVWESGPVDISADRLLAASFEGEEERSARTEAKDFLRELLAGGPVPVKDVEKIASQRGISAMTLKRARWDLGVKSKKSDFGAGWLLSLPAAEEVRPKTEGVHISDTEPLEPLRGLGEPLRGDLPIEEGEI